MGLMSNTIDYPTDAPTGPQTAILPEASQLPPQDPREYAYQPVPPQFAPYRPSRVNKVAAWVGIAAGSLVIVAVLFGGGFYLGRATAPTPAAPPSVTGNGPGGPMIFPMPHGQFERPGPGIVIPNGPTFQLPNIFPQFPMSPQSPSTQGPAQPPR